MSQMTRVFYIFSTLSLVSFSACTKKEATLTKTDPVVCAELRQASSWVPNVAGVDNSNHDSNVAVTNETLTGTAPVTGLAQSGGGRELTFTFNIPNVGNKGSVSLVAETTSFPSGLIGSADPVLTSLNDGTNELINLSASCVGSGFYTCPGGSCSINTNCSVGAPSAYSDISHFLSHQINSFTYLSTNTFPTCNWGSGSPACSFNSTFFDNGKLRAGTYTAKYILLSSNYSAVNVGYTASMKLTVVKKVDPAAATGGAFDLNVILVGANNINASRTAKGQQNLDALFTHVKNQYDQSGALGIKIGKINVVEWDCAHGGDAYANVDISQLGSMFHDASAVLPSGTEGKALNIFLVSTVPYTQLNGTILGVAGGIPGPMINGTGASGLVFSSFDLLDKYNPNCGVTCTQSQQESRFINMGGTIAHEMGHYMGLNHPSESSGTRHDYVPDTPTCTTKAGGYITINSCQSEFAGIPNTCKTDCPNYSHAGSIYCPAVTTCQFNHIMWWTDKNYDTNGNGDGAIFSTNSGAILNYSPYVR